MYTRKVGKIRCDEAHFGQNVANYLKNLQDMKL